MRVLLAVVLFGAAVCFSHLHQGSLAVDGIRYAHIAHLIDQSGNWFMLYDEFKDAAYNNKPPLLLWLVAISLKIFGFSTFAAKLPAAIFVFAGLLLLWNVVVKFYGYRAAFFALMLFCANRVFLRSIIDLNFEGMVLCGALLCMGTCLTVLRGQIVGRREELLFGLGLFLLFQSKPPYVFFIAVPLAVLLLQGPQLRLTFKNLLLSKMVLLLCLLGLSWLALSGKIEATRMFSNQVSQPFTISHNYVFNLSRWARAVFLEFAPLSWLGLWALVRISRQRGPNTIPNRGLEKVFLLAWAASALGIILFIDFQARYLIVPFLSLTILGACLAAELCTRARSRHLAMTCSVVSTACFAAFLGLNIHAHKENGAIALLRRHPELKEKEVVVCMPGTDNLNSKPTRKRMGMLLELEFRKKFPIVMYQTLGKAPLSPEGIFIAEQRCIASLKQENTQLSIIETEQDFSVVQLQSDLPEVTRSGADDSTFQDYH